MIFWQGQLVKLVSFSHQISWIFQFIIEKIIFMSWVWDDVGNENLASLLLFRLILQPLDIYQASRYRSKKVLLDHYCKRKKRKEGESPVKTVIEPFHCVLSNKKVDLISTEKELIFCFFDLQELLYLFISLGFVCTIYNSLVCLIFHLEKHAENPQWYGGPAVVILTLQQSILEGKKLFKKKR